MKWQPKEYQRIAIDRAMETPRLQLWMDKGLGKTSVALTVVEHLMDTLEVRRVLVVSTVRICESVWPAEIDKWDHLKGIPIRHLVGTPKARKRMLDSPWFGIETITFESLTWLLRVGVTTKTLPWDLIIIDESSKLKAVNTRRFRALRKWQKKLPRVLTLTGSPAPAGLLGVWGPAYVLDGGRSLAPTQDGPRTFSNFRERWFTKDFMGWKYLPCDGAEQMIKDKMTHMTVSLRAQDYLELPDLVVRDIVLPLPAQCRAQYDELRADMYLELVDGGISAANGGVLTVKCRQMANGAVYLDSKRETWSVVHDEKLDALDEIVEEAMGEPIIVAYQFKSDLARLQARYKHAVSIGSGAKTNDTKTIADWNAGKHSMLLMHPMSGGHGLNLQDGGRIMVFLGAPWSFDQYDQCMDRIAGGLRRTRPTFIYRIVMDDTVDMNVLEGLEGHRTLQESIKLTMRTT